MTEDYSDLIKNGNGESWPEFFGFTDGEEEALRERLLANEADRGNPREIVAKALMVAQSPKELAFVMILIGQALQEARMLDEATKGMPPELRKMIMKTVSDGRIESNEVDEEDDAAVAKARKLLQKKD